jgi:hypothetical protein
MRYFCSWSVRPWNFLRQRPQRLGEQADLRALDGQFAGARAKQRADDADDVADVPALEAA